MQTAVTVSLIIQIAISFKVVLHNTNCTHSHAELIWIYACLQFLLPIFVSKISFTILFEFSFNKCHIFTWKWRFRIAWYWKKIMLFSFICRKDWKRQQYKSRLSTCQILNKCRKKTVIYTVWVHILPYMSG